jgi:hypothetical protein
MSDYEIRVFRDGRLSLIALTENATDAGALLSIGKIRDSASRIEMWRGLEKIAVPPTPMELRAAE